MANFSGFKCLFAVLNLVVAFGATGCNSDAKPTSSNGPEQQDAPPNTCELGSFPEGNGIINGQPVHPAFEVVPSIVRIYSVHDDGSANVCTGTLLDSETVLTAAHCVSDMYNAARILVHFHHDPACEPDGLLNEKREKTKAGSRANIREASAFVIHAKYSTEYFLNDLALIKLSMPAPATAKPVSITSWSLSTLSNRSKVLAVGYGKTVRYDLKDDNHRLRYGWVKALAEGARREKIVNHLRSRGLENTERAYIDKNWLFFDQSDANGVCAGDSGGPAFVKVNGRWSQVGVASFVTNVSTIGGEVCKDIGAHVNLDGHRDWIRDARAHLLTNTGRLEY